jgi:hypothetical protein
MPALALESVSAQEPKATKPACGRLCREAHPRTFYEDVLEAYQLYRYPT